ncbi:MAG: ribosomal L7Ae/L30e/S12e/Gadd45 family protein [Clostridia bacterium]|nr:ribosomal L7Ae/L30e/S12e/Gadd45 family protein [Clostridia bacterium]
MNNKLLSTLGLARRAGRLTYGFDMVMAGLAKTHLLFLAEDCAERTCRNMEAAAKEYDLPLHRLPYTKDQLGAAIGTKPVGIIGVADAGFARSLAQCIEGGK